MTCRRTRHILSFFIFFSYRWIVDVRHDTSHGQLPSYEVLKAAVAFCFNWIIVNYWQFEDHTIESLADVTNYANYPFIHELLDCYKYLKIYSIWGSRNLKDIKDQTEIYQQLSRLVKQSLDPYFFHESQFLKHSYLFKVQCNAGENKK